jgi:hypothetical protein
VLLNTLSGDDVIKAFSVDFVSEADLNPRSSASLGLMMQLPHCVQLAAISSPASSARL